MSPVVRELWNPWTTAFMSPDAPMREAVTAGGHPPVAGASPFLLASAWERSADGTVQRMALRRTERGPSPS